MLKIQHSSDYFILYYFSIIIIIKGIYLCKSILLQFMCFVGQEGRQHNRIVLLRFSVDIGFYCNVPNNPAS
jgi:hypothetical protein